MFNHSVRRLFCNFIVSSILALLILSTFIYFYHHQNGKENLNGFTDIVWYPNQYSSIMSEGFAWQKFDKNGFNNAYKQKKDKVDILIMGSSHIEAVYLENNKNLCYLLNELLPQYYIYNIGIAGHYLPTIIKNLSKAYNHFKPNKYILIELTKVDFNITELKAVLERNYKKITLQDKGFIFYIKTYTPALKSLLKEILEQIKLWMSYSFSSLFYKNNINKQNELNNNKNDYKNTLNKFLLFAKESVPNNIPIFIFYHPEYTLQTNGSIKNKTDKWYLETFEEVCKKNNIFFIDTDKDFQELYKTKHILSYGFINTAVCSGHLNKYGHEVIAKRLAKEIIKLEGKKNGSK